MTGSTTNTDWPLASAELAFVAEHTDTKQRAGEVLLDGLAKGLIRWDCDPYGLGVRGDFRANPSLKITYAAARGHGFIWRRDEHSRLSVDWSTSYVDWTGPLSGFQADGCGNSWPIFDPCASTSLTASGVRFHHGDVVNWLVALGLRPRPPAEAEPAKVNPAEVKPAEVEPAEVNSTEANPTEAESAKAGPAGPRPQHLPHRAPVEIPRWAEAMGELKRQREHRLDLVNRPTEQARIVVRWLSDRGVEIVESSSKRAKDAELNPNIIPLSERQLIRRIDGWDFKLMRPK